MDDNLLDADTQAAERRMIMDEIKDYPPYLDYPKPHKAQTNADRIRSMSDEELAMLLYEVGYDEGWDKPEYALKWLQQPAKGGE